MSETPIQNSTEDQGDTPASASHSCRICGQPTYPNALICKECRSMRQIPRLHYFASLMFAPLAVPLVLFVISNRIESNKRANESLQSLSRQLTEQMGVAVEFDARVREMQHPCTSTETDPQKRQLLCVSQYLRALNGLDTMVVKLSWMIAVLPIDEDAYSTGKNLKNDYWGKCKDGDSGCLRERIHQEIWTLRWCPFDLFAGGACTESFRRLREATTRLNDRMEETFCHLRVDVNLLLVDLYRSEKSTEGVAERIRKNSEKANCAADKKIHDEVTAAR